MARVAAAISRVYADQVDVSGVVNEFDLAIRQDLHVATVYADAAKSFVRGKVAHDLALRSFGDGVAAGWDEQAFAMLDADIDHYSGVYPGSLAPQGAVGYESTGRIASQLRSSKVTEAFLCHLAVRGNGMPVRSLVLANGSVTGTGAVAGSAQAVGPTAADTTFAAVVRVPSVVGSGSITVLIEESWDNGVTDAWATIGSAATFTAAGIARVTTILATKSWKRVRVSAFSGFTSVSLMVAAGPLVFDPAQTSGLYIDCEADRLSGNHGDPIAAWANHAGSGAVVDQSVAGSRPTLSVVAGVRSVQGATSKYLNISSMSLNALDFTAVVVLAVGSVPASDVPLSFGSATGRLLQQNASAWIVNDLSGRVFQCGNAIVAATHVVAMRGHGGSEPALSIVANGQFAKRVSAQNGVAPAAGTNTVGWIGTWSGLANWFTGTIRAVVAYNRALTDSELEVVMRGMADRCSIARSAPVSRVIAFDGDSLTIGYNTYPAYQDRVVQALTGGIRAYNLGVNNDTVANKLTTALTRVDPLKEAGAKNICVLWIGTNDLATVGVTAATCYANIVAYCQARRALGWKVVVCTITPRSIGGTDPTYPTKRASVNTSIRDNWSTFADALADIAANTTIGDDGDETDTTYYSDLVHLTSTGYDIVDGIVLTAVNSV